MANLFNNIKKVMAGATLLGVCAVMINGVLFGGQMAKAEVVDSTAPATVKNVLGTPADASAVLTWNASTDDTGVEGYYVYSSLKSVETNGGAYTFGSTDVGNSTTYTMTGLSNDVTYYFAVTAYDNEGNESEYSNEVSVTPSESTTGDFTAPTVSDATAVSSTLVEVTFSEEVVLPSTDSASAFSLEATDGTAIEVLDAYSSEDPKTVFLVTAAQTAGAQYILTAGIGIMDKAGNPIESGTSDTAVFTGSSLVKADDSAVEAGTDSGFAVEDASSEEVNEILLAFSQKVINADPSSFTLQRADDATATVEVLAVSIDTADMTKVTLVTEDMDSGYDYVLTIDGTVTNEDGASLPEAARTVEFTAKTIDLADVVAPEDITALLGAISGETSVILNWTASVNTAGDLAKYMVYQSTDGGATFGNGATLLASAVTYTASGLTPGATYTFKVTAMDANGNESKGLMTTVTLPEAGPEMIVLGLMALAGAGFGAVRKKVRG